MPRPKQERRIDSPPLMLGFKPFGIKRNALESVKLQIDEYEAIRLLDYEGLNQEECASFMKVARTTVQRMYNEARRKISDALINGKTLKIKGGNYILCDKDQRSHECHKINCPRFISKIR